MPLPVQCRQLSSSRALREASRHTRPCVRHTSLVAAKQRDDDDDNVTYGANWYEKTKKLGKRRSEREALDEWRFANARANNGRERKDLYTDNWDGDQYKGSGFNILTLLAALFVLVPVGGLAFAYASYGTLWG
jgi:hypothetical protein